MGDRGEQAVQQILKHFSTLKDPRVERTKRHPLINVLVMALCGVLAGANGWKGLRLFSKSRAAWFATFLDMSNGVPCADTFRRVFSSLHPGAFEVCFRSWVKELAKTMEGEVVAVDGKTVRGALGRMLEGTPLHLVHVWATRQRLLLTQAAVPGAPGEIGAIPELLKLVDLKGAVVTVDANGCTPKVAASVLEAGADYVLHLKGNRSSLHKHVKDMFASVRAGLENAQVESHSRSVDQGHGRYEVRNAWALRPTHWPKCAKHWPKLKTAIMLKRERTKGGKTQVEWHYYLTNLKPQARKLARIIRAHWGIENSLHWSLDVGLNEDARRIRNINGAQNFALLSRFALTCLQRETTLRAGIASKRQLAGWDNDYLLDVLRAGIIGL